MNYTINSNSVENVNCDCLILPVFSKGILSGEARELDTSSRKAISQLIKSGDFSGKLGQTSMLYNPAGMTAQRLLLVGAGERKKFNGRSAAKLLNSAAVAVTKLQVADVHIALADVLPTDRNAAWLTAYVAQSMEQAMYCYDTTKSKKNKPPTLSNISLSGPDRTPRKRLEEELGKGRAIGKAINRARQLGNLPGNICTPDFLASEAQTLATQHNSLRTKVLSEKQMARMGMGSLLSVSAGSAEEAKLIIIEHKGPKAKSQPYVLVGKGITFDTGGISLKSGAAMDEMKFDMCGAASVLAVMECVAELALPINVIGMVAAAENMPGGRATKPGDVVTSLSGKTIEILNTDAEGRLVLCDALTYAERFKPRTIIDIATLTGAAVATFGSHANVLLSNNDQLARTLLNCGEESLDRAWQLPLWDEYQSLLNSNFADIANIGGPRAGTITAACFLSRFTEKQKWAHLDIAGSAWHSGLKKGATGRPVGLLMQYLLSRRA
ncbi:MAG: leucyl aminopeptidase [Gammaproteobacteria bacterium]|nr:leucyl aminopeptidase [Gammaproteobacteria bacterium]MCY4358044.1 leucyl aminopeptidase [Gammaproteobacteria bacterium]